MNIAIDTNRTVDFMKGLPEAMATLRSASSVAVPLVVAGELRAGFLSGSEARVNEKHLPLYTRDRHFDRVDGLATL